MPITDKQFDQGLDETKIKVIEFLEKNEGEAFLYDEIAEGIEIPTQGLGKTYNELLLESMVVEGLIEKKILKLHSYFRTIKKAE